MQHIAQPSAENNIADKQHTKQLYELPENVNLNKPFRFHMAKERHLAHPRVFMYSISEYDEPQVDNMGTGERHTQYGPYVSRNVKNGEWLVLKQPEDTQDDLPKDMFGTTFQFNCGSDDLVYTYTKQLEGNPVISWEQDDHNDSMRSYTEQHVRDMIYEGHWTIVPTIPQAIPAQTSQPSNSEESFTLAENAVRSALKPVEREGEEGLLKVIKDACTSTNGRIAVTVYPDHYEVYHRPLFEDCVEVMEGELEEFLKALLVVDGADKWE